MAIAYDTYTDGSGVGGTTAPLTWNHTCSGSDRVLFVALSTGSNITFSVTYNGVAMTKIANSSFNGSIGKVEIWGLLNPASGSNQVSVSWSGTAYIGASSISYTGVDTGQTLPDASNYTDQSSGTTISTTITTAAATTWAFAVAYNNGTAPAVSTGLTSRGVNTNRGMRFADSNGDLSAGSQTFSYTYSPSGNCIEVVVSFAEATTSSTNASFLLNFV